jgi:hypothetical protein
MIPIVFALVREGPSDNGLVAHIRTLILQSGATSALGTAREYKGSSEEKIASVLAEDSAVDIIFVHRDADERSPAPRRTEVMESAASLGCESKVVPVVPVQELEAWLLADEGAIRTVAGKPSGRVALNLPKARRLETVSSPKEVLKQAYLAATEASGARRQRHANNFSKARAILLERLDHAGPVTEMPSWQQFVSDVSGKVLEVVERREEEERLQEEARTTERRSDPSDA